MADGHAPVAVSSDRNRHDREDAVTHDEDQGRRRRRPITQPLASSLVEVQSLVTPARSRDRVTFANGPPCSECHAEHGVPTASEGGCTLRLNSLLSPVGPWNGGASSRRWPAQEGAESLRRRQRVCLLRSRLIPSWTVAPCQSGPAGDCPPDDIEGPLRDPSQSPWLAGSGSGRAPSTPLTWA